MESNTEGLKNIANFAIENEDLTKNAINFAIKILMIHI